MNKHTISDQSKAELHREDRQQEELHQEVLHRTTAQARTIVKISNLTRQFDQQLALNNVSFEVKSGQIFGIVGENGAGKTTLIKHMLGQYIAQQGSVSIFDQDPVANPESVLAKIGYLSEEPDMPQWMTVKQLLNYTSAFYPNWDNSYADQLIKQFVIDLNKRVRDLSKGQKARIGLIIAQAYRPELLLLDEPSSGLDPNVRRDILSAVIKTVSDEGRTVIFSSHLLDEVERVCDQLLMLDKGEILLCDKMDNILANHHRIIINQQDAANLSQLDLDNGIYSISNKDQECEINFYGDYLKLSKILEGNNISIISSRTLSLNEIFVSRTAAKRGE